MADTNIDEKEVEQVQEAALQDTRDALKLKLSPALSYNDQTYDELTFDFDAMTGEDSLAIETELLRTRSITVVEPAYNIHYIERFACRACSAPIGVDALKKMPIKQYLKIRNKTRDFLVRAGY